MVPVYVYVAVAIITVLVLVLCVGAALKAWVHTRERRCAPANNHHLTWEADSNSLVAGDRHERRSRALCCPGCWAEKPFPWPKLEKMRLPLTAFRVTNWQGVTLSSHSVLRSPSWFTFLHKCLNWFELLSHWRLLYRCCVRNYLRILSKSDSSYMNCQISCQLTWCDGKFLLFNESSFSFTAELVYFSPLVLRVSWFHSFHDLVWTHVYAEFSCETDFVVHCEPVKSGLSEVKWEEMFVMPQHLPVCQKCKSSWLLDKVLPVSLYL